MHERPPSTNDHMKKIFLLYFLHASAVEAQPYLDIAKASFAICPRATLSEKRNPLRSQVFTMNVTMPIELRKDGDAFIINPFFEHTHGKISTRDFHTVSQGALLGFLKKDLFQNWDILSGFTVRVNKEADRKLDHVVQYGGVLISTWKKNKFASLKFGLYYNKEFFGNYFIPLLGIDWQINGSNNLFGVLPGNMTFEHKVTNQFYFGASFHALTNSYRLPNTSICPSGDCKARNYLRVDDNQLGLFADTYLAKKIVFSAEGGYSILRRYRFGLKGSNLDERTDYKNDNLYVKASIAYRLRFR